MPSLVVLASVAYFVCFPCRYPYVSTRDCRGDLRGAVRHRARGYRGCCYDYLTRQGGDLCHYFITFCSCLDVALERGRLILSTLYAMFKTHTAMIPTSQKTIVLLSYC